MTARRRRRRTRSSLYKKLITSLTGGISKQPPTLRFEDQGELQENWLDDPADGKKRRPALRHVSEINSRSGGFNDDVFVHWIDRDDDEQYVVTYDTDNGLKVHDLQGNAQTVTTIGFAADYLKHVDHPSEDLVPSKHLRAVSIVDFTFVVNRTFKPQLKAATDSADNKALIYVRDGQYATNYRVTIGGETVGHETPLPTADRDLIQTGYIAGQLRSAINADPNISASATKEGNVIVVSGLGAGNSPEGFEEVTGYDDQGDRAMTVVQDTIENFADLPPNDVPEGFVVKVVGANKDSDDDYWVKYTSGAWVETVGPGSQNEFDETTMPHVLVRTASGDFEFRAADSGDEAWAARQAGDEETAPAPSFVDREIRDVVFFKNRLGFLAGQNMVFTRIGDFFNFWPQSVIAVRDDDPIDVAASTSDVAILERAVPYDKALLLFTDRDQFIMEGGDVFSPRTVGMDRVTSYEANPEVRPSLVGRRVFFVSSGKYTRVWEYSVNLEGVSDAVEVTSHVPKLIPTNARLLATSKNMDLLLIVSEDEPETVFVYRWLTAPNGERVLSSWGTWTFGELDEFKVFGMRFFNDVLYFVTNHGPTGGFLEKMEFDGVVDNLGYEVKLDHRKKQQGVYNASEDRTEFSLPYSVSVGDQGNWRVVGLNNQPEGIRGYEATAEFLDASNIAVPGNWTTVGFEAFTGRKMISRYIFSPIYPTLNDRRGNSNALLTGRLQLRTMTLDVAEAGPFDVRITHEGAASSEVVTFTPRKVGPDTDPSEALDPEENEQFTIGVMGNAKKTQIEARANTHHPVTLVSAEWEGMFYRRGRSV